MRTDVGAPRADSEAASFSQETAVSDSAAVAALPSSLAQPPSIGGSAHVSPPVPPSQTAPVPGPPPSQPVSLAPPTQAGPTPFATESAECFSDKADHASQRRRPAVRQGSARSAAGRQSAHRHSKLNAGGRAAFHELITQLTAETKSVDQQLTPPQSGQPDPFAQPVSNK
jgi:hypothetical protein